MRILIVANKVPYPPKDGGAIATLSLATALAKAGTHIKLLSINTPKHYCADQQIPHALKLELNIETVFVDTTIKLHKALSNLLFSNLPYNAERFINEAFRNRLTKILREKEFDVVQLEGLYLTPYIETIKQHSTAKVALRAHNVEHEIWERTLVSQKNPLKKLYIKLITKRLKRMEQEAVMQIDLLVPISNRDKAKLIEIGCSAPSLTIPFGIEASNFYQTQAPNHNSRLQVFHLGGLDWQPNQDGLLWFINHCWPLVLQAIPNARFTIAGRNAPKNLISQLRGPGIEYIGEIENAKQFIANSGVMVVPLRIGSGMRIKIIEGMALGKAIVSTAVGAEGIDYTNGQNIMIGNSPKELAEAIVLLLTNSTLKQEIGLAAKTFATQTYCIHTQAEQLLNFYKKSMIQIKD
ncbi:MAG: glycosyltransferase [Bacteroidales bacterium]|nr:glycosyltransferase [Bacteroidales bacterium]MBN2750149.1 glycosyltransferase [Bacteroidales bacterium]